MTLEKDLFQAAEAGDAERVLTLLSNGADVNARNGHQSTPLIRATSQEHANVVKLLLHNQANAALKDDEGCTALDRAMLDLKYGSEVGEMLLNHWRERYRKEQPIPPERIREFLEAHSHCYHAAFQLRNGSGREGSMSVEEDRDIVIFHEPFGIFSVNYTEEEIAKSWFADQEEIAFEDIDMSSLMW